MKNVNTNVLAIKQYIIHGMMRWFMYEYHEIYLRDRETFAHCFYRYLNDFGKMFIVSNGEKCQVFYKSPYYPQVRNGNNKLLPLSTSLYNYDSHINMEWMADYDYDFMVQYTIDYLKGGKCNCTTISSDDFKQYCIDHAIEYKDGLFDEK